MCLCSVALFVAGELTRADCAATSRSDELPRAPAARGVWYPERRMLLVGLGPTRDPLPPPPPPRLPRGCRPGRPWLLAPASASTPTPAPAPAPAPTPAFARWCCGSTPPCITGQRGSSKVKCLCLSHVSGVSAPLRLPASSFLSASFDANATLRASLTSAWPTTTQYTARQQQRRGERVAHTCDEMGAQQQ